MATFLFWNVHRNAIGKAIATLCKHHSVDVLILAEANFTDADFQKQLAIETGHRYFALYNGLASRLKFFVRDLSRAVIPVLDMPGMLSIREVRPLSGHPILLAAVHLSSKLYADSSHQYYQARTVVSAIEEAEARVGHSRTMVIGDFNMNPFEEGLVNADAFHSAMTQAISQKKSRKVGGINRRFFYNPMWGKLGDGSDGPTGTYYYRGSKNRQIFWNMFDQVLLRPDLLPIFTMDNLKILTEVGITSLLTANSIDRRFSDHLPIMIKLPIELEE